MGTLWLHIIFYDYLSARGVVFNIDDHILVLLVKVANRFFEVGEPLTCTVSHDEYFMLLTYIGTFPMDPQHCHTIFIQCTGIYI